MTSPLQKISQYVRHARNCAQLARACQANGNPIKAELLRAGARSAIEVARKLKD